MGAQKSYIGRCFCGKVEVKASGDPLLMGFCHCSSCREWSGAPVNAFSLWQRDQVQVTKGADQVATFNRTEHSFRKWCKACGGHLLSEHPNVGVVDLCAALLQQMPFKPVMHVNYQEAFLHIRDGLPKMKDVPKEFGGSGEVIAE
jgi:hypothetical protein